MEISSGFSTYDKVFDGILPGHAVDHCIHHTRPHRGRFDSYDRFGSGYEHLHRHIHGSIPSMGSNDSMMLKEYRIIPAFEKYKLTYGTCDCYNIELRARLHRDSPEHGQDIHFDFPRHRHRPVDIRVVAVGIHCRKWRCSRSTQSRIARPLGCRQCPRRVGDKLVRILL